uniref:Amiloride-sensitive sodium channel subunit gamma n=1 Tax=Parastrongyloides trichosuri TaxID=131310 RepID=A0A0N4ZJN9_PARTI
MTTGILTSTVNGIYYKSFNADPQKFLIDFTLHDNHYRNTKLINSTKSFPNKFGNCYIHQGKNDYPIERVGKDFGLSLILEAKVSDIKNRYRKGLGIDPIFGVHMKIEHENDTQNIDFNSNFLSMGYEVNVPITIEKETNDKSFSNCRELATDLSDNFFRQTKYSLDTCFTCCLKEKQYDSCGYETPFSPNIAAYRLNTNKCQTKECYQCSKEELFPDTNEKKKAFFNNCKCLLPCESYRHMYSPSVSKLHVGNIGKLFNYNAGDDKEKINIKSNFVFLNFYIKDLMVKTRTEVVDQIFSNLFSDLGNNLSLLLGIGVFNIVEVLFCLIAICYNRKATGTGFGRDDHLT